MEFAGELLIDEAQLQKMDMYQVLRGTKKKKVTIEFVLVYLVHD